MCMKVVWQDGLRKLTENDVPYAITGLFVFIFFVETLQKVLIKFY